MFVPFKGYSSIPQAEVAEGFGVLLWEVLGIIELVEISESIHLVLRCVCVCDH